MTLSLGSSGLCSAAQHVVLWEDPTQHLGRQRRLSGRSFGRWQLSRRGLCLPTLTVVLFIQLFGPGDGAGATDKMWPLSSLSAALSSRNCQYCTAQTAQVAVGHCTSACSGLPLVQSCPGRWLPIPTGPSCARHASVHIPSGLSAFGNP